MRLGGEKNPLPKPMVTIGNLPIVVHIMQYYAFHGHTDFILCVGWKADIIRDYFSSPSEYVPSSWNVQIHDSGIEANIGQRLNSVQDLIEPGETFFANYADGVSDVPLDKLLEFHNFSGGVASFVSVQPKHNSFHVIDADANGEVTLVYPIDNTDVWMNGGFFVFSQSIFDYIGPGEELVEKPFEKLIAERQLFSYRHDGFWACMDTFKEKEMLDHMYSSGEAKWKIWAT